MALADQNDRIQYYGMYFTSRQSWHAGQDAPQVHVRGCAGVDVPYIQVGVHYSFVTSGSLAVPYLENIDLPQLEVSAVPASFWNRPAG